MVGFAGCYLLHGAAMLDSGEQVITCSMMWGDHITFAPLSF